MKKIIILSVLFSGVLFSCKRDYTNPNAPSEEQVFSSTDGLTKVIVGLKQRHAVTNVGVATVYSAISSSGLSTGEVVVLNAGNADLAQIQNGGQNLAPNNGVLTSFWVTANVVNSEASKVLENLDVIPEADYKAAVQAYAMMYKALSIGSMAMFWEEVPVESGPNAAYVNRQQALQTAVQLLDDASNLITPVTIPTSFTSQVGSEIDLKTALVALSARYNIMLGNYDAAIAKASAVTLTSKSIFFYNTLNPNPVYRTSLITNNVYGIAPNFGLPASLQPDPADKRIGFYLTKNATNGSGFFLEDGTGIPLYLPGEMLLIQAEAYARKDDLPQAVNFLNQVLTKTTDAFGLGAGLPAYSGAVTQEAILTEIYKNRSIELYMSGSRLEDSRRFSRPGPGTPGAERTRNYYPYPQQERDGNPNTPSDPEL